MSNILRSFLNQAGSLELAFQPHIQDFSSNLFTAQEFSGLAFDSPFGTTEGHSKSALAKRSNQYDLEDPITKKVKSQNPSIQGISNHLSSYNPDSTQELLKLLQRNQQINEEVEAFSRNPYTGLSTQSYDGGVKANLTPQFDFYGLQSIATSRVSSDNSAIASENGSFIRLINPSLNHQDTLYPSLKNNLTSQYQDQTVKAPAPLISNQQPLNQSLELLQQRLFLNQQAALLNNNNVGIQNSPMNLLLQQSLLLNGEQMLNPNIYQDNMLANQLQYLQAPLMVNQSNPSFIVMSQPQIISTPQGQFAVIQQVDPSMLGQVFPSHQPVILMDNSAQPQLNINFVPSEVHIPDFPVSIPENSEAKMVSHVECDQKENIEGGSISTKDSEGYKSESEDSLSEPVNEQNGALTGPEDKKKRTTKPKPPQQQIFFSPLLQTKKTVERRRNKWQMVQEQREQEKLNEKVRLINETEINHDDQKIVNTPVGENHQAQVPSFVYTDRSSAARRQVKSIWNPEKIDEEMNEKIFVQLPQQLKVEIDQEKMVKLYNQNNGDIDQILKQFEGDEKKCQAYFALKIHKKKTVL